MKYVETESIELKRNLNDTFQKEVVAFLNSLDGIIYLGIEDNGEICGIDKLDETMKKIADIISTSISPASQELVKVKAIFTQNKFIIEVSIKKGNSLYYINKYGRSSKGCYIRVGTSCRSMNEEQIEKRYIETIKFPKYSLIQEESPRQDLTFRVFKIYLDENKVNYDENNIYINNNLIMKDGKFNYLAFILSDQFNLSIKISKFSGKTKQSDFVYRKEFGECCILKAIDDIIGYIDTNINTVHSYFDGKAKRKDEFLIDKNSFREGWINACLHNDFSTHLGPSIFLYEDHLEIFSYGSPLNVQPKEEFLKGASKPINPELARIFMKVNMSETSGRGINTIVRKYGEKVFEFSETCFRINLPYNKLAINNKNKQTGELIGELTGELTGELNLSDNEIKVYEIIKNNLAVTRKEIIEQANLSKNTIDNIIKRLKDKGLILGKTSKRNGYWKIN